MAEAGYKKIRVQFHRERLGFIDVLFQCQPSLTAPCFIFLQGCSYILLLIFNEYDAISNTHNHCSFYWRKKLIVKTAFLNGEQLDIVFKIYYTL